MNDDARFIEAIRINPGDHSLRLAYADWLEENGDPRAEFLRLTSDLASPLARTVHSRREHLWSRLQELRLTIDAEWLVQTHCLFHFLSAINARERMDELEYFLEFWYGAHKREYGEPEERLQGLRLPYPLRRFYRFAGRWPSSCEHGGEFFYSGSGHHLLSLNQCRELPNGRVNFFMEYQGDWDGITLQEGEDPPVWIEGTIWDEKRGEPMDGATEEVCDSLSRFLISHCLKTIYYDEKDSGSAKSVKTLPEEAVLIWKSDDRSVLEHGGSLFLVPPRTILLQDL